MQNYIFFEHISKLPQKVPVLGLFLTILHYPPMDQKSSPPEEEIRIPPTGHFLPYSPPVAHHRAQVLSSCAFYFVQSALSASISSLSLLNACSAWGCLWRSDQNAFPDSASGEGGRSFNCITISSLSGRTGKRPCLPIFPSFYPFRFVLNCSSGLLQASVLNFGWMPCSAGQANSLCRHDKEALS